MTVDDAHLELARLAAALTDRYRITGTLGQGGMATVYRATDLKHQREVAIKVLRTEVSQALGAERFLNEIGILAKLQHPRILPLYDSGEAGGLLYYVMPLVEGDSLRARLERDKQLPIGDAVRIAREVGSALVYAHARGIVHRDIKPENVLISDGEAIVADFGIARAISAASNTRITATGVSVGTPAYMSPEQASGDPDVGPRSDIYSLGCLLFEMLAGEPPFGGPDAATILRRHFAAPVPQIEIVRATVSPALSRVIERALAKVPADRQASVQQFIDELKASETGTAGRTVPLPSVRTPHLRRKVLASLAAVVVLGVGGVAVARRLDRPPIDPARVAVLPFRVSGDSGLAYLQEGMVDLLTTQLGSVNGVRPVDTRTVLAAWHREVRADAQPPSISDAISIAAKLGSGQLVDGSLVGSGRAGEITISARLVDVEGADRMPEPVSVTGSRDSLFALVDQLTSKLIAEWVQEPARRLEDLTSASLPAVRAYLDGRAAYRLGEFDRAQASFTRALELDTTFALAALGMASTGAWSQQAGQSAALRRGLLTGYALRSRLSRRDQLLFEAYVLPDGGAVHTARDQLVAWQRASEAAPESPEAQYAFGDRLYHSGIQLGIVEAEAQAESAFVRALALDSTFVPPLAHLVEVAARLNDRTRTQRLARLYASEAAKGDNGDYVRWRVAHAVGDRRALDSLHARRGRINQSALNRMIGFGLTDAMPMDDVDAAANELKRRVDAGTFVPENVFPGQTLLAWALNRGRRADAERAYAMLRAADKRPAGSSIVFFSSEQAPLLAALFWDGDSAAAGAAATRIESRWTGEAPRDRGARARYYTDLCVLALWRQATGGTVEPWRLRLRAGAATADSTIVDGADPVVCLTMIDLREAISAGRTESEAHVARLDSILTSGPYVFGSDWGNIVLSRAYVARGDLPSALRVIRRRPYDWDTGPLYLSTYLREEAQLAAASGDAAGARRAYTRFLALRAGADDPYRAQVDSATRAIGRLP